MISMIFKQQETTLWYETVAWQKAAFGFLGLSVLVNTALLYRIGHLESQQEADADHYREQIEQAEHARDLAVEELESFVLRAETEQQAQAAQAAAYEALDGYRYIGECTVTAYCPCETCCGQWADGLTATGIPVSPGMVAVDPDVIALGSTVIIDGQQYLAADTGVTGNWVDIFLPEHDDTVRHGVRTAEVWVVES